MGTGRKGSERIVGCPSCNVGRQYKERSRQKGVSQAFQLFMTHLKIFLGEDYQHFDVSEKSLQAGTSVK